MDIKKLRVCTSNDKQFLKEFSNVFESHFDELGGNWLKHKNCNTILDSHWFFRTKLWELVKIRFDVGTKTVEKLPDLSGFAICTLTQRKFLDELEKTYVYLNEENLVRPKESRFDSRIWQNETKADLQKVIEGK